MKKQLKRIKIINYLINPIKISYLLNFISKAKKSKKSNFICISNVHSCIESYRSIKFKIAHNSADLALPDGRPIYWALKLLGSQSAEHLPGYYITEKICDLAKKKNLTIGFYGSTSKNLSKIKTKLTKKYRNLKINYLYSPPFRKLSLKEELKVLKDIKKSKIDILFVCLGCPKQELWMYKNKNKINCTMLGIGAVADFLSGNKILPNKFFEYLGLAWLVRLISEPRRLFWRYFSTNFLFIFLFFLQITGLKKFN